MSEAGGEPVLVDRQGPVGIVTISRPAEYNALNGAVLAALGAAVAGFRSSADIGAIVITGAGTKAFSAGADLKELDDLDAVAAGDLLRQGQAVFAAVEHSPVPVVAAVNGLALGGGFELVLACTFPVLATTAALGLPESGLGLIPGYGGTQRLPRVVGPAVAAHAMLTGARITADRAYQLGLTPVEPIAPEDLLPTAVRIGEDMSARGPRAQAAILQALRLAAPSPAELALESSLAAIATASAEGAEGISAFRARRSPQFRPRQETHA